MKDNRIEAVTQEGPFGGWCLEVSYSMRREGDEYSDAQSFIGDTKEEVVASADVWVRNMKAEGWDVGCWDDQGNFYH